MNSSLRTSRRSSVIAILFCGVIGPTAVLLGQDRDFSAERIVLDDDAGDGTRNTLTLETPGGGLSGDRTLMFPDADGMMVTTSASGLGAGQILFGGPAGEVEQSANLLWTDATSILSIGSGNFIVDGATGDVTAIGVIDLQGSVANSMGNVTLNDDVDVTGDLVPTTDNMYSLGTDAFRWGELFINEGTLHIGPGLGGSTNTELELTYIAGVPSGTATIDVDGSATTAQLNLEDNVRVAGGLDVRGTVQNGSAGFQTLYIQDSVTITGVLEVQEYVWSSTGDFIVRDPLWVQEGLAVGYDPFGGAAILVTSGPGADVVISEGGIDRSNAADQTFEIDNTGAGDLSLLLNGATSTTNSRLTVDNGHWTSQQTTTPTAAVAGANVTSAALVNETDVAGFIDITTSGTPAAGAQATVTFDAAYNTAPIVVMMAANGPAAGVGPYVDRTTTGFTINFIGVPAASTSHQYFYQVIETQ